MSKRGTKRTLKGKGKACVKTGKIGVMSYPERKDAYVQLALTRILDSGVKLIVGRDDTEQDLRLCYDGIYADTEDLHLQYRPDTLHKLLAIKAERWNNIIESAENSGRVGYKYSKPVCTKADIVESICETVRQSMNFIPEEELYSKVENEFNRRVGAQHTFNENEQQSLIADIVTETTTRYAKKGFAMGGTTQELPEPKAIQMDKFGMATIEGVPLVDPISGAPMHYAASNQVATGTCLDQYDPIRIQDKGVGTMETFSMDDKNVNFVREDINNCNKLRTSLRLMDGNEEHDYYYIDMRRNPRTRYKVNADGGVVKKGEELDEDDLSEYNMQFHLHHSVFPTWGSRDVPPCQLKHFRQGDRCHKLQLELFVPLAIDQVYLFGRAVESKLGDDVESRPFTVEEVMTHVSQAKNTDVGEKFLNGDYNCVSQIKQGIIADRRVKRANMLSVYGPVEEIRRAPYVEYTPVFGLPNTPMNFPQEDAKTLVAANKNRPSHRYASRPLCRQTATRLRTKRLGQTRKPIAVDGNIVKYGDKTEKEIKEYSDVHSTKYPIRLQAQKWFYSNKFLGPPPPDEVNAKYTLAETTTRRCTNLDKIRQCVGCVFCQRRHRVVKCNFKKTSKFGSSVRLNCLCPCCDDNDTAIQLLFNPFENHILECIGQCDMCKGRMGVDGIRVRNYSGVRKILEY